MIAEQQPPQSFEQTQNPEIQLLPHEVVASLTRLVIARRQEYFSNGESIQ